MRNDIIIREISQASDPATNRVEEMFHDMYLYMNKHGLKLKLAEGGERKWLDGILKGLGRFGILLVASIDGEVVGFAHGGIRLAPDYLASKKLGVITHVFVEEEYRETGAGKQMVLMLESWFSQKEVDSVELQVLADNISGTAFWEKLGYLTELNQHRKAGSKLK